MKAIFIPVLIKDQISIPDQNLYVVVYVIAQVVTVNEKREIQWEGDWENVY